jgi:hypothetical protein
MDEIALAAMRLLAHQEELLFNGLISHLVTCMYVTFAPCST